MAAKGADRLLSLVVGRALRQGMHALGHSLTKPFTTEGCSVTLSGLQSRFGGQLINLSKIRPQQRNGTPEMVRRETTVCFPDTIGTA